MYYNLSGRGADSGLETLLEAGKNAGSTGVTSGSRVLNSGIIEILDSSDEDDYVDARAGHTRITSDTRREFLAVHAVTSPVCVHPPSHPSMPQSKRP